MFSRGVDRQQQLKRLGFVCSIACSEDVSMAVKGGPPFAIRGSSGDLGTFVCAVPPLLTAGTCYRWDNTSSGVCT